VVWGITPREITPSVVDWGNNPRWIWYYSRDNNLSDVDWGNNPRWFRELQDVRVVLVSGVMTMRDDS
jgi:hypothetical protein